MDSLKLLTTKLQQYSISDTVISDADEEAHAQDRDSGTESIEENCNVNYMANCYDEFAHPQVTRPTIAFTPISPTATDSHSEYRSCLSNGQVYLSDETLRQVISPDQQQWLTSLLPSAISVVHRNTVNDSIVEAIAVDTATLHATSATSGSTSSWESLTSNEVDTLADSSEEELAVINCGSQATSGDSPSLGEKRKWCEVLGDNVIDGYSTFSSDEEVCTLLGHHHLHHHSNQHNHQHQPQHHEHLHQQQATQLQQTNETLNGNDSSVKQSPQLVARSIVIDVIFSSDSDAQQQQQLLEQQYQSQLQSKQHQQSQQQVEHQNDNKMPLYSSPSHCPPCPQSHSSTTSVDHPRKRHCHIASSSSISDQQQNVIQRPCLDFEKMQRLLFSG